MTFIQLIIIAILVESIWETTKMLWQSGKFSWDKIGALVIGILVAVLTQIDIFTIMGIELTVPIIGVVMTGFMLSRGSNYIHDLVSILQDVAQIKNKEVL